MLNIAADSPASAAFNNTIIMITFYLRKILKRAETGELRHS